MRFLELVIRGVELVALLCVREIAAVPTASPTSSPTSVFCTATKCKNGGSCNIGDTKCACVGGYSGRTCSQTPSPTPSPTQVPCQPQWGQCGGQGWRGSTCCTETNNSCVFVNGFYYQCQPSSGPPTPAPHQYTYYCPVGKFITSLSAPNDLWVYEISYFTCSDGTVTKTGPGTGGDQGIATSGTGFCAYTYEFYSSYVANLKLTGCRTGDTYGPYGTGTGLLSGLTNSCAVGQRAIGLQVQLGSDSSIAGLALANFNFVCGPITESPSPAPAPTKRPTKPPTIAPSTVKPSTVKPTHAPTKSKPPTVAPSTVKPSTVKPTAVPVTHAPTNVFCTATKCKNGGTCVTGSTSCTCPSGWTDRTCSTSTLPQCTQGQELYGSEACTCAGNIVSSPFGATCSYAAPNARACDDKELITVAGSYMPSCNCPKEKVFWYFNDSSLYCGAPLCDKHGVSMYFGCDCSQGHDVGQNESTKPLFDVCAYDAAPNAALCTPAQKIYPAADNPRAAACQCPASKLTIKYGTPVQCGGPKCAYGQHISTYPSACDCSTGTIYTDSNGGTWCLYYPTPTSITAQCTPGQIIYDGTVHCSCPLDKVGLYWTGALLTCS